MKFRQKIVLFLVIVVVDWSVRCDLADVERRRCEKDFKGDLYHERNKEEMSQGSRKIEKTGTSCRGNRTWYGRRRPI